MRPEYEPITIRGRQIKAQIQGIKEVTYGGKTTITRYWVWSKINWDSLGLEITKIPIGILVIFKDKENWFGSTRYSWNMNRWWKYIGPYPHSGPENWKECNSGCEKFAAEVWGSPSIATGPRTGGTGIDTVSIQYRYWSDRYCIDTAGQLVFEVSWYSRRRWIQYWRDCWFWHNKGRMRRRSSRLGGKESWMMMSNSFRWAWSSRPDGT